jgi:hypothetical protein
MFQRLYSWRLKRRQYALALAWCGDRKLADWLLQGCVSSGGRLDRLATYRHMANRWLQHVEKTGEWFLKAPVSPPFDSDSTRNALDCEVRLLISQMPMMQRMTLSLIDVVRLSYRETAEVMNIGLFDVQHYIVTARRQLLEEIHNNKQLCGNRGTSKSVESANTL